MNQETCKYLTEEVLKQCWHEPAEPSRHNGYSSSCLKCGVGPATQAHTQLTFTTANDIKLLADKMKEDEDDCGNKLISLFFVRIAGGLRFSANWVRAGPQEQAQLIANFYRNLNRKVMFHGPSKEGPLEDV